VPVIPERHDSVDGLAAGGAAGRRRPAVKICGVCRAEDAAVAAAAGASYVGVILVPGRPRSRTTAEAAEIFAGGYDVLRVGVFVDAPLQEIAAAAGRLRLDVVQLHGSEERGLVREVAARTGARVWKAVRVRDPGDVTAAAARYVGAVDALLLDGWSPRGEGGVGAAFDAAAVAPVRAKLPLELELVVAGGLTPDSVGDVVRLLDPAVVDVSSGVEEAVGRKSAARVRAFIAAAHAARPEDR
jgi:phosphoribosylanthranilate isomerase